MLKIYISLCLFLCSIAIKAQFIIGDGYVNNNDSHVRTTQTIIDGKPVFGSPFFDDDWLPGRITLADGGSYNQYLLKYNILNQVVMFKTGKDSLEADQVIKEFTLLYPKDAVRFINPTYLKSDKKPMYYKVLSDNAYYSVLETYTLVVSNISDDGMNNKQIKYLKEETAFFYVDKTTEKRVRIKPQSNNIAAILNLTVEDEKKLLPFVYDFRLEPDVLRFFNHYFLYLTETKEKH